MFKIEVETKNTAGKIDFVITTNKKHYDFHFFIKKDSRQWGYGEEWYDGLLCSFGLGPLMLICWMDK